MLLFKVFKSYRTSFASLFCHNDVYFSKTKMGFCTKKILEGQIILPDPPKKPLSAFLKFISEKRQDRDKYGDMKSSDVQTKLASVWSSLTESEKQPYVAEYEAERDKYKDEYKIYMENLTPEQISTLKVLRVKKRILMKRRAERKERKKDFEELGKPKSPGGAFLIFISSLKREDISLKDFMIKASEKWKALPLHEQENFKEKARKLREEYNVQLHNWEMKMIDIGRGDLVRKKKKPAAAGSSEQETDDEGFASQ